MKKTLKKTAEPIYTPAEQSRREELHHHTKRELINIIVHQDVSIRRWHETRGENENFRRELEAAKESYLQLEKVQQEIVARLERAYEALVKQALR